MRLSEKLLKVLDDDAMIERVRHINRLDETAAEPIKALRLKGSQQPTVPNTATRKRGRPQKSVVSAALRRLCASAIQRHA